TYFNITDNILAGNYPAVLTALDDVLRKGFSPQTFTAGFGVHLRDLLMCRDGQTAGLLEVTGSLLERYREQAARCQTGFLFEALSLVTTLDSGLRTATNQRLNVELCLMKLCSEGQKKTPGNQPPPHPGPIEKLTLPELRGGGAQPHMPGRHSADDPQAGASRSATGGSPQDNDPAPSADTAPVGATPSPAHGGDSPGPGPDTSRDRGSDGSKTAREGDPIPEPRPESDVTPAPDIRDTAVEGDSSITERHTAPDGKPGTENAPGARGGDHIPETHTGEKPGTGGKDTQAAAQTRPVPEGQASGSEAEPGSRTPQAEPQGKVSQSERRVGDTVRPNSAADSASGGPAPQTARKNIRSALLGPSITDLLEKPVGIYDMPPEEQGGGSALPAADPETAHKIEKHRERFLKLLGAGRPRLAVPFREMAVGGNKITVTVPTAELHDEIMRNRTEILTLLADTASVNGYIELAVEVKEDSGPKLPVRVEDKLRYLTRKNPNLNLLRQKLEMDIE
ncbi:MAG: hypothetical protein LUE10_09210, partial [Alistipes sp.]|nr:hypothetical protein [Alistipes sp.]